VVEVLLLAVIPTKEGTAGLGDTKKVLKNKDYKMKHE
jgi:hypothetical protein